MNPPRVSFINMGREEMFRKSLVLLSLLGLLLLVFPARAQETVARFFVFYAEGCSSCQAVEAEILTPLSQKYGKRVEIRRFEITVLENYEVMRRLEREWSLWTRDTGDIHWP